MIICFIVAIVGGLIYLWATLEIFRRRITELEGKVEELEEKTDNVTDEYNEFES